MFICEIWLFDWYFPQFSKSDMSKYGYLEVFQRVPSTSRVHCNYICDIILYQSLTVPCETQLNKVTTVEATDNVAKRYH